jgi:hypothetical protein
VTATREKSSFRLPPELVRQLDGFARVKRVSRTAVVEAAIASYLSPDGADRLEAALGRRLDRVTRQVERLALHVDLSNETLSMFIRSWLNHTAPLPESAVKAAHAMGAERWERFVAGLSHQLESGVQLAQEVGLDIGAALR